MNRRTFLFGLFLTSGLLTGCVERRYVITSDPPGAVVLVNNEPIGATPVDGSFVYYGDYHITLMRDGCETLQVDQKISTPWYEYFPIEFVAENLIPYRIKDVRRFHYLLQPQQMIRSDQTLLRAQELRQRGEAIGQPAANTRRGRPAPQPPQPPAPIPGPAVTPPSNAAVLPGPPGQL